VTEIIAEFLADPGVKTKESQGAHSIKVGAYYLQTTFQSQTSANSMGYFNGTGSVTGNPLADVLLGRAACTCGGAEYLRTPGSPTRSGGEAIGENGIGGCAAFPAGKLP
jgi:hypothetical protein